MKYIKKPIPIDAMRLDFKNKISNMEDWFLDAVKSGEVVITGNNDSDVIYCEIKTLEGIMIANDGDYIIKGIHGELYPCKKDIFEESYIQV